MRFGAVALEEAEGAILAHTLRLPSGALKKGRVLSADDLGRLRAAGRASVIAARLDADDVREDEAARAVAEALAGDGVRLGEAFTGRCNLLAAAPGVLVVDAARIEAANAVHEAVTVATLEAYAPVDRRRMVATVKIVPFAVARAALDAVRAALAGGAVSVAPYLARPAGLVQTVLEGTRESVLDKTSRVLGARLAALGCAPVEERRCAHDEGEVAAAIAALAGGGARLVLVIGASATVDRRDVVPAAVERAGGDVERFGMPVDPGNLTLFARLGGCTVLCLPGSARSPKRSGTDRLIERAAAGLPVAAGEVPAMGVGGLLKEIPERPQPRAAPRDAPARPAPRVAALVLAAGQSRRMGEVNKLLVEVDGAPMVAHAADAALAGGCAPVVVVTGHEHARVEAALAGRDVRFVRNPSYGDGLSTSLRAGLAALAPDVDGALVCLGDMPRVGAAHVERLIAAFDPAAGRAICVPTHAGKRGNPVLFASRFFPQMIEIDGDTGARHLLGDHADAVHEVAMDDRAVLTDVDSPEALARLAADR